MKIQPVQIQALVFSTILPLFTPEVNEGWFCFPSSIVLGSITTIKEKLQQGISEMNSFGHKNQI